MHRKLNPTTKPERVCARCSEKLPEYLREDAKFCNDRCRHKANAAVRCCIVCKLHHPSVGAPDYRCAPCTVHEKIVVEKLQFHVVVGWMNEHHVCFYCGEWATEREHVVPQHTLYPTWVVPSCRECNRSAGGKLFESVLDKYQWIKEHRIARYQGLLAIPDWTWNEIHDLGPSLRAKIEATQKAKDIVYSQVNWNPLALKAMVDS